MNRLQRVLDDAREKDRKLLSVFVTAGFPQRDMTPKVVEVISEAGADFVEIGMPFSDPLADGPAIQEASQVALSNGMTTRRLLDQLEGIRRHVDIPLLLMGYINPILKFGLVDFVRQAAEVGVDGFIIPDLPPEESEEFLAQARGQGLSMVFLAAPNTSDARLRQIDEMTDSFVYCVSVTGVTGERSEVAQETVTFLERCRSLLKNPYLVGFGISGGAQARRFSELAHGVIVGSAVIKRLGENAPIEDRLERAASLVREVRRALDEPT
jgi:tryptophan synthase alpha chain